MDLAQRFALFLGHWSVRVGRPWAWGARDMRQRLGMQACQTDSGCCTRINKSKQHANCAVGPGGPLNLSQFSRMGAQWLNPT
eukprot:1154174-Pelagomonas_calceolata.AAC.2